MFLYIKFRHLVNLAKHYPVSLPKKNNFTGGIRMTSQFLSFFHRRLISNPLTREMEGESCRGALEMSISIRSIRTLHLLSLCQINFIR